MCIVMKISNNLQMNDKNTLFELIKKFENKVKEEKLHNLWFNYLSFRDTFSFLFII